MSTAEELRSKIAAARQRLEDKERALQVKLCNGHAPLSTYTDLADLTKPIPPGVGIGIECDYEYYDGKGKFPTRIRTILRGKRTITLSVTSWVGTSPGAQYFYGKLRIGDPDVEIVGPTPPGCKARKVFGTNQIPEAAKGTTIRLSRPLTREDVRRDGADRHGPVRWERHPRTDGFYSEAEVKRLGRRIHKRFFPDWKLVVEGDEQ